MSSPPRRVQRRRVKGWRTPPNTIICDRTSDFGNPFTIADALEAGYGDTEAEARDYVVRAHRYWIDGDPDWVGAYPEKRARLLKRLPELAGKDLACTCGPDVACHVDTLLRAARRSG